MAGVADLSVRESTLPIGARTPVTIFSQVGESTFPLKYEAASVQLCA